jgi:hypothetical protein
MHLIKDTEVFVTHLNVSPRSLQPSSIDYFIQQKYWPTGNCLIVLPLEYTPDFFLGLCIVEGIKVPEGIKICNHADYQRTIDKDKSIVFIYTLAVKI